MPFRPLKSFFPSADQLLQQELPALGENLLAHLNSYQDRVKQQGALNKGYFRAMLENRNVGLGPLPSEPEYGTRQAEVTKRMMEAWNWLERQGLLIHKDERSSDWFTISTEGETLLLRRARYEKWERFGLEYVRGALAENRWYPEIGESDDVREEASQWVRMKDNKPPVKRTAAWGWELIAGSRLDEVRSLTSVDFDFGKLIRLCEELNIAYREDCYFATAMLTRSLLDHVPPIFGMRKFEEVANNYGGKSFKSLMQHLQAAARSVADGHLHQQIRKSETLPTAQQVNCSQQLDALLEEIVRVVRT